jgi:hypothetical protein
LPVPLVVENAFDKAVLTSVRDPVTFGDRSSGLAGDGVQVATGRRSGFASGRK